ncbi:MAG: hypothetical protein ACRDQ4_14665 [Pseudonocardiaceae bacterium]
MPDLPTGVLVRLRRVGCHVSPVSLAAHAEASLPTGPLSPSGDALTVLRLGEE